MSFQFSGDMVLTIAEGDPGAIPGEAVNPAATSAVESIAGKELRWNGTAIEFATLDIVFSFWTDDTATTPKEVQAGWTIDGMPFFLSTGAATWVTATPAPGAIGGSPAHGMMLNPRRSNTSGPDGGTHGWDGRTAGYQAFLNRSGGVWMRPGDAVCKVKSRATQSTKHWGKLEEVAWLQCLRFAPEENAIIESARGASAVGARRQILFNPPSSFVDLTITGGNKPTVATAVRRLAAFNPSIGLIISVETRRQLGVVGTSAEDNYGQALCLALTPASVMLCDAAYTVAEKQAVLLAMASRFCECYWPFHDSATSAPADGAQQAGWIGFMSFGALATGQTSILANLNSRMGGNELRQTLLLDADLKSKIWEPHSNAASSVWPGITRRTTVTNVSGNVVTVAPFPSGLSYAVGQPGAHQIVRESDGATALVSAWSAGTSYTVDAQPGTPFAIDDVVYLRAYPEPQVGDAVWSVKGANISNYDHSNGANYRIQQRWGGAICALRAYGLLAEDAPWEYVKAAAEADNPTSASDWRVTWINETVNPGGGYDSALFAQHEATLEATPFAYAPP